VEKLTPVKIVPFEGLREGWWRVYWGKGGYDWSLTFNCIDEMAAYKWAISEKGQQRMNKTRSTMYAK
jgi:hypothetical protein